MEVKCVVGKRRAFENFLAAHLQTENLASAALNQQNQYRRRKNESQACSADTPVRVPRVEQDGKAWQGISKTGQRQSTHDSRLLQKQMRPGPATRAALLGEISCGPSPRTRHEEVHAPPTLREASTETCTRQIATREANFASQPAALRWPTASPAVCGGLCEEAATPGRPVRRSAFWRNPPGNSPSRITRNRQLCRNALAGHTKHSA